MPALQLLPTTLKELYLAGMVSQAEERKFSETGGSRKCSPTLQGRVCTQGFLRRAKHSGPAELAANLRNWTSPSFPGTRKPLEVLLFIIDWREPVSMIWRRLTL